MDYYDKYFRKNSCVCKNVLYNLKPVRRIGKVLRDLYLCSNSEILFGDIDFDVFDFVDSTQIILHLRSTEMNYVTGNHWDCKYNNSGTQQRGSTG